MVEFAIVGPPFIIMLCAIFETGMLYFNQERLEFSTAAIARQIMTGQFQKTGDSTADLLNLKSYLCPGGSTPPAGAQPVPGSFDCSKLIVDVRVANSFSNADVTKSLINDPGSAIVSPGGPGTVNVLRVLYPQGVLFSGFNGMFDGFSQTVNYSYNGSSYKAHILMGTAVFRTEPYK